MNYYEHHLGDFKKDAAHLTMLQEGAYRRLIDAYYIREAPIASVPATLIYQIAGAHSKPERAAVDFVLQQFFTHDIAVKVYRHKRCDEEIGKYHAKSESARGSANARWSQSKRNATASNPHMRNGSESHALQSPVPSNQSPDTHTDLPPRSRARPAHVNGSEPKARVGVEIEKKSGWKPPTDEEWYAGK